MPLRNYNRLPGSPSWSAPRQRTPGLPLCHFALQPVGACSNQSGLRPCPSRNICGMRRASGPLAVGSRKRLITCQRRCKACARVFLPGAERPASFVLLLLLGPDGFYCAARGSRRVSPSPHRCLNASEHVYCAATWCGASRSQSSLDRSRVGPPRRTNPRGPTWAPPLGTSRDRSSRAV
jgi:hypothetical protein